MKALPGTDDAEAESALIVVAAEGSFVSETVSGFSSIGSTFVKAAIKL